VSRLQTGRFEFQIPVDFSLQNVNPLSSELNPIHYLLALLAHDFFHVSRIRVKSLTLRLLMSYIYDISNLRVNSDSGVQLVSS
jgi:hypothetical protein